MLADCSQVRKRVLTTGVGHMTGEVALEGAMDDEIGIAANGTGEVAILRSSQGIVPDADRSIGRLGQTAQNQQMHRQRHPSIAHLVQQSL